MRNAHIGCVLALPVMALTEQTGKAAACTLVLEDGTQGMVIPCGLVYKVDERLSSPPYIRNTPAQMRSQLFCPPIAYKLHGFSVLF
jgi:hypothetical protein